MEPELRFVEEKLFVAIAHRYKKGKMINGKATKNKLAGDIGRHNNVGFIEPFLASLEEKGLIENLKNHVKLTEKGIEKAHKDFS